MLTFLVALILTPLYLKVAQKLKLGKQIRDTSVDGAAATVFKELHAKKSGTPTMGGIIIWISVLLVIAYSRGLAFFGMIPKSLLDRGQVYLPLFTIIAVGILGAIDDVFNIKSIGGQKGIAARPKFLLLTLFGALGAWWFYSKLGFSTIHIPSVGDFEIGLWYIPLFILVIVSTANAVNITDGLDGLAGGLLILAFIVFGAIAYAKGLIILAIFCGLIIGALMAFLWNNVPPALFYMGDTGSLSLGATLGVIAMMTDSIVVLLIVGCVFIIETLSVIIQLTSKSSSKERYFSSLHYIIISKKRLGRGQNHYALLDHWSSHGGIGLIIGLIGMGDTLL
ncbi:phospho-N-acetylmuramoyl-pentapeptide-transferase [Candidatus Peregrinibacteria bacterium]|nr:MAG: phospho-N-acetylmuramoyl-pentapeptide-transferase [Candidatus Peregrinibacteria bacterium]